METKRADVYFQVFAADLTSHADPAAILPAAAAAIVAAAPPPLILAGDAAPRVAAELSDGANVRVVASPRFPDAAVVARLAAAGRPTWLPPAPIYLRPPDVTPPRV